MNRVSLHKGTPVSGRAAAAFSVALNMHGIDRSPLLPPPQYVRRRSRAAAERRQRTEEQRVSQDRPPSARLSAMAAAAATAADKGFKGSQSRTTSREGENILNCPLHCPDLWLTPTYLRSGANNGCRSEIRFLSSVRQSSISFCP